jgi:hypothetical protein
MSNVVKTTFIVTSTDTEYSVPGDWTADALKANYANQVPGIGNMNATETTRATEGGLERVVTFSPRTGSKGVKA